MKAACSFESFLTSVSGLQPRDYTPGSVQETEPRLQHAESGSSPTRHPLFLGKGIRKRGHAERQVHGIFLEFSFLLGQNGTCGK